MGTGVVFDLERVGVRCEFFFFRFKVRPAVTTPSGAGVGTRRANQTALKEKLRVSALLLGGEFGHPYRLAAAAQIRVERFQGYILLARDFPVLHFGRFCL